MDEDQHRLSVKDLIRSVSEELIASRDEREAAGEQAIFEVEELSLEISFVATRSKDAKGGFKFWVVNADAGVKYDDQSVQKVVLKLKAAEDDTPFGNARKFRPRRVAVPSDPQ